LPHACVVETFRRLIEAIEAEGAPPPEYGPD
jgi:hypothetical protein